MDTKDIETLVKILVPILALVAGTGWIKYFF